MMSGVALLAMPGSSLRSGAVRTTRPLRGLIAENHRAGKMVCDSIQKMRKETSAPAKPECGTSVLPRAQAIFGTGRRPGPRPTLPPGGRIGGVARRIDDRRAFENTALTGRIKAPTQGRARLSVIRIAPRPRGATGSLRLAQPVQQR